MFIPDGIETRTSLTFREIRSMPGAWQQVRRDTQSDGSSSNHTTAIVLASVVVGLFLLTIAWIGYRRWRQTKPAKYSRSGRDDNDHGDATTDAATSEAASGRRSGSRLGHRGSVSTVDRNTSVRSVMTLPPYRPKPLENESVLGREGERDGIDVVVELPTAEDEEALREEEMDALFQIRLARRRQLAEREERRQARRDARARNDQVALQTLRDQARAASTSNTEEIEALREEHNRVKETRQRAVSSVSYAELGVARHDGTRIRANSTESERVGLLSDAASIAVSARSPSSLAQQTFPQPELHRRGRSASSVLSIDTTHSDSQQQLDQLPLSSRSRTSSAGQQTRAGSSPELVDAADADLGDADMPPHSPPGYDEVSLNDLTPAHSRSASPYAEPPPDYTPSPSPGPTEARNRRLSAHVADIAAEASIADASGTATAAGTTAMAPAPAAASTTDRTSSNTTTRSSSNNSEGNRRSSRSSGIPQLPSLRLAHLPQIVIEPSSAVPREDDR